MGESNSDQKKVVVRPWEKERDEVFGRILPLHCLERMVWYYRRVRATIRHCAGDPHFAHKGHFFRMTQDQVRNFTKHINIDLLNYSLEFYLQRRTWSQPQNNDKGNEKELPHESVRAEKMMKNTGFRRVIDGGIYSYEDFIKETLTFFIAIHSHLVSINKALGELYCYVTEFPFVTFTKVGQSEILHLTKELDRIMTGFMVAIHLQPRQDWQSDIVSYLNACRIDCQRFFDTIPLYYESHRRRLILYPIEHRHDNMNAYPVACLPLCAGVYLDFVGTYQNIAFHVRAIINWAIRMYSTWYYVREAGIFPPYL